MYKQKQTMFAQSTPQQKVHGANIIYKSKMNDVNENFVLLLHKTFFSVICRLNNLRIYIFPWKTVFHVLAMCVYVYLADLLASYGADDDDGCSKGRKS
jgi:hypothetical protein